MNHSFDVGIAKRFGVNEAIFIENLRFWINKNKANKRHFYDGRYWTYNSVKAFAELFPYWSKQQVERLIQKLKAANVLLIGHYNPNSYDRTNWYSFSDGFESLFSVLPSIDSDESTNKTDINTVVNTDIGTARGSRLPDNFEPDFDFAVAQGIKNPSEEANKFRDYWTAQPGAKGVKANWQATWRNWCRNSKKPDEKTKRAYHDISAMDYTQGINDDGSF